MWDSVFNVSLWNLLRSSIALIRFKDLPELNAYCVVCFLYKSTNSFLTMYKLSNFQILSYTIFLLSQREKIQQTVIWLKYCLLAASSRSVAILPQVIKPRLHWDDILDQVTAINFVSRSNTSAFFLATIMTVFLTAKDIVVLILHYYSCINVWKFI